jgi:hypothetical protein
MRIEQTNSTQPTLHKLTQEVYVLEVYNSIHALTNAMLFDLIITVC